MTVVELIEKLMQCNLDAEITLYIDQQETGIEYNKIAVVTSYHGDTILMADYDALGYITSANEGNFWYGFSDERDRVRLV